MAHGNKKWIIDYRGKVKRSNNRTKLDYYGDLKWWHANDTLEHPQHSNHRWHRRYYSRVKYCPQCQHVKKPIREESRAISAANAKIKAEYTKQYAEQYGEFLWYKSYDGMRTITLNFADGSVIQQRVKDTRVYYPDFCKTHPDNPGPMWHYDTRSYLCFKCEHKYEKQREMWYGRWSALPGSKANYGYTVKAERQRYRNKVRNQMQRAKYDDDLYDEMPTYKRGWLD